MAKDEIIFAEVVDKAAVETLKYSFVSIFY